MKVATCFITSDAFVAETYGIRVTFNVILISPCSFLRRNSIRWSRFSFHLHLSLSVFLPNVNNRGRICATEQTILAACYHPFHIEQNNTAAHSSISFYISSFWFHSRSPACYRGKQDKIFNLERFELKQQCPCKKKSKHVFLVFLIFLSWHSYIGDTPSGKFGGVQYVGANWIVQGNRRFSPLELGYLCRFKMQICCLYRFLKQPAEQEVSRAFAPSHCFSFHVNWCFRKYINTHNIR